MKCLLIIAVCAFVFVLVAKAEDEKDDGCTDGTNKKEECNTCYCTNKVWACTRKQCNGPMLTIKNKRNAPNPCRNGDSKLDDDQCNQCSCHDGRWACTEKLCPPIPKN